MDKINYVSIPQSLILSQEIHFKSKYLYIMLKKNSYNSKIKITTKTMMNKLRWKDNRTFKKYLIELLKNNYVLNITKDEINKLSPTSILTLNLQIPTVYIMIDSLLIDKVLLIDKHTYEKGLIYLYINENFYNSDWGYSCLGYEYFDKLLKMSRKKIKDLIWLYHDNYICEYYRMSCIIVDDNTIRPKNRYIVNNYNNNRRRYVKHKQPIYFGDTI